MILEVKDLFESISEKHKMIQDFQCIEDTEKALSGEGTYPTFILELPFMITMKDTVNDFKVSFMVLDRTALDKTDELIIISKCVNIAQDCIDYIREFTEHEITEPNVLTLQGISMDNISGCKVEFDLILPRVKKSRTNMPFED